MKSPFKSAQAIYERHGGLGVAKRAARKLFRTIAAAPGQLVLFHLSGRSFGRYRLHQSLLSDNYFKKLLGMTSVSERAFLQWYCQRLYTGKGLIVELGPFIGATTCCLARGLALNENVLDKTGKFYVYDKFQCDEYMANKLNQFYTQGKIGTKFHVGDSFKPEFERQTASFGAYITLFDGELSSVEFAGSPIEVLFIDAMKDVPVANRIVQQFYGALIPGQSIVIHQDFVHYWTSWIHIIQYELRALFQFEYFVPESSSVAFRYLGGSADLKNYQVDLATIDDNTINAAFAHSCSMVPRDRWDNLIAAKVMLYIHKGDLRTARRLLDEFLATNPVRWEMCNARDILVEREAQQIKRSPS